MPNIEIKHVDGVMCAIDYLFTDMTMCKQCKYYKGKRYSDNKVICGYKDSIWYD